MKIKVQVVIESERGSQETVEEVAILERGTLRTEALGLTLAEARDLLHSVQRTMVTHQINQHLAEHSACSACGKPLGRKGKHTLPHTVRQVDAGESALLRMRLPEKARKTE